MTSKAELDSLPVILKTIMEGKNEPETDASLLEFLNSAVILAKNSSSQESERF